MAEKLNEAVRKVSKVNPAFPFSNPDYTWFGMTLRDWFAGQALAGLMSDPGLRPCNVEEFEHMAKRLYQVADALLSERDKGADR